MHMGHGWRTFVRQEELTAEPTLSRPLLRRVFAYARPHIGPMAGMLVTVLLITLIEIIPPLLIRDLIDNALPGRDATRLNWLALGLLLVPILSGLIDVVQRWLSSRIGEGIIYSLRQEMYEHLQAMSFRFYTLARTGELMSRFNSDVVGAQRAVTSTLTSLVTNVFTLVATLIVLVGLEWRLTLAALLVLPFFLLPARRVGVVLRAITRQQMEHNARLSDRMHETLSVGGALLVRSFGRQRDEITTFRSANEAVREKGVQRALVGRWFILGLSISAAIGTAVVYWAGGHLVLRDQLTVGTIVAFAAYLGRLYNPITQLVSARIEFITALVSFERVFEYLDLPLEIEDRPGARDLEEVRGHVVFDNVSFTYQLPEGEAEFLEQVDLMAGGPQQRAWALEEVSFEIEPGQLVALVGPSGAGKTTVTYLLPRLYDPTEGKIYLDGYDLRDLTQQTLAQNIGVVTQTPHLFHASVADNLRYARPGSTLAEMEAACRAAFIHDFIASLPDAYDTIVGEGGYRLSGGERQRIALARIILSDPAVLVLDEATSHLDSLSEAYIQQALEEIMRGRTSLVIAHRLSTILKADKILVMSRGRLVETGTHRDLLARGGLYAHLYETQFRVIETAAEGLPASPDT
jgi:ATP-binding cassette, subfamily B, bacterial